jgi:hypothetical protein
MRPEGSRLQRCLRLLERRLWRGATDQFDEGEGDWPLPGRTGMDRVRLLDGRLRVLSEEVGNVRGQMGGEANRVAELGAGDLG